MKDWLITEFYTFIEIVHRRKAILLLPCLGMILFILLDTWMQHLLLETVNKASKSIIDFTPIFVKHYEKMRRIAFFEIVLIGSFLWAIKEYLKMRKRHY
ncbi:hypothetical protein [Acinetobacter tibetensis]|uniref:Uncharacterized protein n=1 Tax=Acinetobacter tibetensis TaxID=2943497 RepID=A0AAE9LSE6_9GAMM|nr:hypothetical protein [Acinetobacter tibetensis]USE83853.1 hypothetical protein M5E07_03160 [Acinetobacter tibetensis]